MPRNLSTKTDFTLSLTIILVMIAIISQYNRLLGIISFLVWMLLVSFIRERQKGREKSFVSYQENVIENLGNFLRYSTTNLPIGIVILDKNGYIQWYNSTFQEYSKTVPKQGKRILELWKELVSDEILSSETVASEGEYTIRSSRCKNNSTTDEETSEYFWIKYRHLKTSNNFKLVALFMFKVTQYEKLKLEYKACRITIIYVQIDNYDEITQGLDEVEKTSLMLSISEILNKWVESLRGLMRKISSDLFIIILEQSALEQAIEEKFSILDKIHNIVSKNQIQVTVSMGVATADKFSTEQSISELGEKAQTGLELALGRGGDQVAINIEDKFKFFGGRTKAIEKNTRVRARVMARFIRNAMNSADKIFVMGHSREDYDSFGSAVGVALMAKNLKKSVQIVLSDWNDSIEKILNLFKSSEEYNNLIVRESDVTISETFSPLLIVVDTFIPELVAAPSLLERIKKNIVIDHHRRSENTIKNSLMSYLNSSSSSTCEMITELLMYFDKNLKIDKLSAIAIYSGIIVDTKNFMIQTGARTFEAAAFLRRSGADSNTVNELFKFNYDTTIILSKIKSKAEYYKGGLVVSTIENIIENVQAVAGQAADSLLRIDGVYVTVVLYQMSENVIGISARSVDNFNVQVVMEKFGGGGHQNVAGAQIKNISLIDLKKSVVKEMQTYIDETSKKARQI